MTRITTAVELEAAVRLLNVLEEHARTHAVSEGFRAHMEALRKAVLEVGPITPAAPFETSFLVGDEVPGER